MPWRKGRSDAAHEFAGNDGAVNQYVRAWALERDRNDGVRTGDSDVDGGAASVRRHGGDVVRTARRLHEEPPIRVCGDDGPVAHLHLGALNGASVEQVFD